MIDLPDDWKGTFVERDKNGAIKGVYAVPQPGRAEEPKPDGDPEVASFMARIEAAIQPRNPLSELDDLKARIAALEARKA